MKSSVHLPFRSQYCKMRLFWCHVPKEVITKMKSRRLTARSSEDDCDKSVTLWPQTFLFLALEQRLFLESIVRSTEVLHKQVENSEAKKNYWAAVVVVELIWCANFGPNDVVLQLLWKFLELSASGRLQTNFSSSRTKARSSQDRITLKSECRLTSSLRIWDHLVSVLFCITLWYSVR